MKSASSRLFKHSSRLPVHQPLTWREYFSHIIAKDPVLWIALILGALSCLIIRPPLAAYSDYIDFKTLACLASLMVASGGFMISGLFDVAAARLANRCRSSRGLMIALVFCTFFASMVITNDVALIVFVPITLLAFQNAKCDPVLTLVLQTVAANVGSICLPMGNPQNRYLYSRFHMTMPPFLRTVLPLSLAGAALLLILCLFAGKTSIACIHTDVPHVRRRDIFVYTVLFAIAALAVFDSVDYRIAFAIACVAVVVKGRNLAQQVDIALLLTFIGFFLFVGSISHVPEIADVLRRIVEPRPFMAAAAASQIISNVPAAVMLSGFTTDAYALLAGVSAGGCGTLIASMASLITYKLYARSTGERSRYLLVFTLVNMVFLAVIAIAYLMTRPG